MIDTHFEIHASFWFFAYDMTTINENEYLRLFGLFERECKRVEVYKRRALTKNESKLIDYKESLVRTYNGTLTYLNPLIDSLSSSDKIDAQSRMVTLFKRLKECFPILKFDYPYDKNIDALIDIDKIAGSGNSNADSDVDSDSSATSIASVKTNLKSTAKDINNTKDKTKQNTHNKGLSRKNQRHTHRTRANSQSSSNSDTEMTQTVKEIMAMANNAINYRFDGDPLKLDSFIDAIELLKEVRQEHNETILLKFLMTRLEGKAREAIVTQPETPDDIIDQLKLSIQTESSKVIEGRILALRADKMNLTKFAERAEELADEFRRSLVVEGFSKQKAKELSIEKTVELCRKSARNDTVQAIIASTKFSEPKEAIAKMIVEINNLKLFRNSSQYTHKHGNQKNGNGHSNKFNKNNNRNSNSNSNSNSNDGRYNNNNRQNSYNGRQNFHGHGNNRNNQNGHNSRTFTNSNSRRSNEQPVRMISGNETNPGNGGQTSEQQQQ